MSESVQMGMAVFLIGIVVTLVICWICHIRKRDELYYIDRMDGLEFEDYLLELFGKRGMDVWPTQATRDFGADLIIHTDSEILILQVKRYQDKVGLEAVQQVAAAVPYYKGTRGIVITNNYYTDGAYELAAPNGVQLLDRDDLKRMLAGEELPPYESMDEELFTRSF